ncbi:Hypothetical protein A7982_03252 [Minicystis rosea]|nr:Hypothetical protein A7982_03252 [Minicystis rosea]
MADIKSTNSVALGFRKLAALMAPIAISLVALGCSDETESNASADLAGKSFVLVHGAWNGAWVWSDVAKQLEARGASVTSVDLLAHGDDMTPISETSLTKNAEQVRAAVEAAKSPVILVGHSFGGAVISQAAEARPKNLDRLIYLAAFIPANGESVLDLVQTDADSALAPVLQIDAEQGIARVPMENLDAIFCADCKDPELALLDAKYRDEPLGPAAEKLTLTSDGFGSIPKSYIYTSQDRVISPGLQQSMSARVPLTRTATLNTSHSPFLSTPADLVATLADFSKD